MKQTQDPAVVLAENTKKQGDCIVWTGTATPYGKLRVGSKFVRAHRLSYELVHGPIPNDQCVLHRCDNPRCVKPDHLFLGTRKDNIRDAMAKGRYRNGKGQSWEQLSDEQVREARRLAAAGTKRKVIADLLQTSLSNIYGICSGRYRKGVI